MMIPSNMKYAFQPIFYAGRDEIYGYEALMRPVGCSPLEYIDKQKRSGKLHEVECMTFYQAADAFLSRGLRGRLFVNSFPDEVMTPEEFEKYFDTLPDGFAENIIVELLEYHHANKMCEKLHYLKEHFPVLALDDFGTGYNDIAMVNAVTPGIVKIDRSYIRNLQYNKTMQHMLRVIIRYLHARNICVVAEGVETKAEYDFLTKNNADFIQGYYTGRPE